MLKEVSGPRKLTFKLNQILYGAFKTGVLWEQDSSVSMNSARTDASAIKSLPLWHNITICNSLTHKITITLGNDNINYYNSSVSSLRVNSVVELVEMVSTWGKWNSKICQHGNLRSFDYPWKLNPTQKLQNDYCIRMLSDKSRWSLPWTWNFFLGFWG